MITPEAYDYSLPENLIAREPAAPRDAARLFVYDTSSDTIELDTFRNLGDYLPREAFLVLNKTRVVPARLELKKSILRSDVGRGGGKVVALFLTNEHATGNTVRALFDRGVKMGERLTLASGKFAEVITQEKNIFTLRLPFGRGALIELLERQGTMPIPPYLRETTLSSLKLRREYQTIFAARPCQARHSNILENVGMSSAAAPTASLHFTERAFADLRRRGIGKEFLTLHVGLGTFAPVAPEQMRRGRLHEEWFDISPATAAGIALRKKNGERLVAVGTTVVRAIESAVRTGDFRTGFGATDIFIRPPYRFRAVDALVTNFHVPKSSLMMLVDAFLAHRKSKRRILDLYKIAIRERIRFFSFGDAMLIR